MNARPGGPAVKTSAQPGTRISCHAALVEAARAPFSKERRMKFAKATKFHRKSGKGLGIDPQDNLSAVGAALNLRPLPPVSRARHGTGVPGGILEDRCINRYHHFLERSLRLTFDKLWPSSSRTISFRA
jgi:hypothetical protein